MAVSQKNLYRTGTGQVSAETLSTVQSHLNRAIEIVWLTAAFLVPLIVLSEHDFTSFTELPKITLMRSLAGLGVMLWLMAAATSLAKSAVEENEAPASKKISLKGLVKTHPIESAAASILIVTAISTAFSIQPRVSALGAEWGRDGFDLHTTSAYIALFFLAATRIRSRGQVIRLWATISISGLLAALVGIAQHFAMAPFGISGTYQHQRVTGTVGNPLFLGSLLTVTLPMAAAFAIAGTARFGRGTEPPSSQESRASRRRDKRRPHAETSTWFSDPRIWWGVLGLIVFIHVYAALFTASRGPWIGMAAALIALIVLTFKAMGPKPALLAAISVAGGAGLAYSFVLGPVSSQIESLAIAEQQELFAEQVEAGTAADALAPRGAASVIGQRGSQNTFETRRSIWSASTEVITERPSLPESNNAPWLVRQLFGHGPDTFRFVFPTKSPAELMNTLTSSAHNDPLNRLVEIGITGLLSYGLLVIAAGLVVWRLISSATGPHAVLFGLLAVGAGAMMAGRVVEQLSGVPEVSDTTLMWMAFALLAAALSMTRRGSEPESESAELTDAPKSDSNGISVPALSPAFVFPLVAIGIALTGYFIWTHNINLLRSDLEFKKGEVVLASDVDQALAHMEKAVTLNPGVEEYGHARAEILNARAELNGSALQQRQLLEEAYEAEVKAYSFNPTSRAANFELAFASWQLAQLGDGEKAQETLETYERLSVLAPSHPLVIQRLEQLKLAVGSN